MWSIFAILLAQRKNATSKGGVGSLVHVRSADAVAGFFLPFRPAGLEANPDLLLEEEEEGDDHKGDQGGRIGSVLGGDHRVFVHILPRMIGIEQTDTDNNPNDRDEREKFLSVRCGTIIPAVHLLSDESLSIVLETGDCHPLAEEDRHDYPVFDQTADGAHSEEKDKEGSNDKKEKRKDEELSRISTVRARGIGVE